MVAQIAFQREDTLERGVVSMYVAHAICFQIALYYESFNFSPSFQQKIYIHIYSANQEHPTHLTVWAKICFSAN
jgi:hypothetical protein